MTVSPAASMCCLNSGMRRMALMTIVDVMLVEHDSFESREQAILSGSDIHNRTLLQDFSGKRMRIGDTDKGKELLEQIASLEQLLQAYRTGFMRERR